MHKIIPWFIHNAVAANLLMLILVIGGILALPQIHQEEFPTLNVDAVQILTPYLGAAPEEVESAVCVRIEEAIKGNEGIDKITSQASEGLCSVTVELVAGVDKTKIANDIKNKVDAIDAFPAETEQPITSEVSIIATVFEIVISGPADERTLKLIGQRMRDEEELLLAPQFFFALGDALPDLVDVQTRLKHDPRQNELTRYRYDVVLSFDRSGRRSADPWRTWPQDWTDLGPLTAELKVRRPQVLALAGVPNLRLEHD